MSRLGLRVGVRLHQPTVGRAPSLRIAIALCSLVVAASADRARAADWPLRGSMTPTYTRWDGYYAGGQFGQSYASADFSNGSKSQINFILANTELQPIVSTWTTLPKGTTGGQSFGGFFGYNVQWENVIMGGELNYNHFRSTTARRVWSDRFWFRARTLRMARRSNIPSPLHLALSYQSPTY